MAQTATTGSIASGSRSGRFSRLPADDAAVGNGIFALLLAYCVIEFVRPQALLGSTPGWFRPALAISIVFFAWWIKRWGPKEVVADRMLTCIFLFVVMSAIWTPFALNNFSAMQTTIAHGIALGAVAIPLGRILVSRRRRSQFFFFWMLILLYLAVFVLANNGQGPGGVLQDENDMAFALSMGLPYPYLLSQQRGLSALKRAAYLGLALLIVFAIVSTHSRGGFLGMACVVLYLIYLSSHKIRNLIICGVLGLSVLMFAPDSYFQRIGTITDMEDSSINERLTTWRIAGAMFLDNPIVGVGPRNYPWHTTRYQQALPDFERGGRGLGGRAAHSVYFTVLPEYGIVGTGIFFVMLGTAMLRLGRCEKLLKPLALKGDAAADADLLLARAHKASIIAFLTAGAFISVFYYPQIWYTVGFVVALTRGVSAEYGLPPPATGTAPEASGSVRNQRAL